MRAPIFIIGLVSLGFAAHAAANDPYVGYVYPAGLAVGATNRIVIGGQRLGGVNSVWISGEGVRVLDVEHVPAFGVPNGNGQRKWLENRVYEVLAGKTNATLKAFSDEDLRGWRRCPWWERMETLDPLEFAMTAHYLLTPRNPLQMSAALAERIIVTVAADDAAQPGVRELVLVNWKGASVPHPFIVSTEPRASEPLYAPPKRKGWTPPVDDAVHSVPVVLDGQILPRQTDVFRLSLHADDELLCRLTGRELMPYLADAVPGFFNPVLTLTDGEGRELACADDFYYLPDPVLRCRIPSNGVYRLEVRDNVFRGREDFVYSIVCTADGRESPTPEARAFACNPPAVADLSSGEVLSEAGETGVCDFEVEKPGTWTFDLFARRLGSPLDGVLRLYGPLTGFFRKDGPLLATWDDATNEVLVGSVPQSECDPRGEWTFTEPGEYRLEVSDRVGAGGEAYRYRLDVRPAEPTFEAYATRSTFTLTRNRNDRLAFDLKIVRRNGFAGEVRVAEDADFSVVRGIVPAGTNETTVVLLPKKTEWSGMIRCRFTAIGVCADRTISVPIVPADAADQAFAYHHLIPARDFLVYRHPPDRKPAACPSWPEMPFDAFLPRRVIYVDRSPVLPIPADAERGVLAARLGVSPVRLKQFDAAVAVEPKGNPDDATMARAVLGGVTRLVKADLSHADGDARRIRFFASAAGKPNDNDLLVFVPSLGNADAFAGPLGDEAMRLWTDGWCFDFVDAVTITNAPCGRGWHYPAVLVPAAVKDLDPSTRRKLEELQGRRKCEVVFAGKGTAKEVRRQLAKVCRRETVPPGIRFARFGKSGEKGWYFAFNPTGRRVSGEWTFGTPGKARAAYSMDVGTGERRELESVRPGTFKVEFRPGAAHWIRAYP